MIDDYEQQYINQLNEAFKTDNRPNDDGIYYDETDYQELERNLVLYKQGNREAATYIIKVFHPFITKYVRFIVRGDLPYYTAKNKNGTEYRKISQTITSFVALFNEKEEGVERKKQFSNTCVKIKRLFSKYEYFDIYNELTLALFNMANKYKIITNVNDPHYKKNGTFHMYVSKCFHWEAYRFLSKLIRDPLTHADMILSLHETFDDIDADTLEEGYDVVLVNEDLDNKIDDIVEKMDREWKISHANKLTQKEDPDMDINDMANLNFNWTSGITCGAIFQTLTSYEREILLYLYVDKKSTKDVAEIYGCHRSTINEHRNKAIEKIRDNAKKLNISL